MTTLRQKQLITITPYSASALARYATLLGYPYALTSAIARFNYVYVGQLASIAMLAGYGAISSQLVDDLIAYLVQTEYA